MRGRARGFVMLDLIAGMAVIGAAAGLMVTLAVSMVAHVGRLRHSREIDAFATGVLESVLAGGGRPVADAGGGALEVPQSWQQGEARTEARIEALAAEGELIRIAVVVEEQRQGMTAKTARFETIVPRPLWGGRR